MNLSMAKGINQSVNTKYMQKLIRIHEYGPAL